MAAGPAIIPPVFVAAPAPTNIPVSATPQTLFGNGLLGVGIYPLKVSPVVGYHRLLDVEVDGAGPLLPVDVAPGRGEGGGAAGGDHRPTHPGEDGQ